MQPFTVPRLNDFPAAQRVQGLVQLVQRAAAMTGLKVEVEYNSAGDAQVTIRKPGGELAG